LALSLAARTAAPRAELATSRALEVAAQKLNQALAAQPPEDRPQRQLALAFPVQDPRIEACAATLTEAMADQRTVRVALASGSGAATASRRMDPYRLLPGANGLELLGYCHDRRRFLRLPVARLQSVSMLRRRFRPVPARLLERHLHPAPGSAPQVHWIRLLARPPLAQALRKHPPVGTLMWERGPDGSIIFMIAAQRPGEFLPWVLSCADTVEILEPSNLRQEVLRIARAVATRYTAKPAPDESPGT
jgi:predicted DNA-binding transcriptional regulator YafY